MSEIARSSVTTPLSMPFSPCEEVPAGLRVVIADSENPPVYPPRSLEGRLSSWSLNPIAWISAVIRWALGVDARFEEIAQKIAEIAKHPSHAPGIKTLRAGEVMRSLSRFDRCRIAIWRERFLEKSQEILGDVLINMERPDLCYGDQTHHFVRYRRVEAGAGIWNYQVDNQRGVPTSYQSAKVMDDTGNLRVVLDKQGNPVAGACSVPNDVNKALEAVLPLLRAKIARGEIKDGDIVPIAVHSLLSPTVFTSDETKMLDEEMAAYEALAAVGELTIEAPEGTRKVKLLPMVINTQTNWFDARRNVPIVGGIGYNTSDEWSRGAIHDLCRLVAEKEGCTHTATILKEFRGKKIDSPIDPKGSSSMMQKVHTLLTHRDGYSRLSAAEEAKLIKELSDHVGGLYLVHCKSGLDRTGLILAHVLAKTQQEAREMIDEIFLPVTFMSTGFPGFKWSDKQSVGRDVVGEEAVATLWSVWKGYGRLRKS